MVGIPCMCTEFCHLTAGSHVPNYQLVSQWAAVMTASNSKIENRCSCSVYACRIPRQMVGGPMNLFLLCWHAGEATPQSFPARKTDENCGRSGSWKMQSRPNSRQSGTSAPQACCQAVCVRLPVHVKQLSAYCSIATH